MHVKLPQPLQLPGTSGTCVVLLHAYTGSPNDMNLLARGLNRAGHAVIAPLFAGHGTLDPEAVLAASPAQWWAQTQQAVAAAANVAQRVAVFGLSLGGLFAMRALTSLTPVALGGVFASPILPTATNVPANFLTYYAKMCRLTGQKMPPVAEIMPRLTAQLAANRAFTAATVPQLATLTKPVFIGQGTADEMIDPQQAVRLQQALPAAPVTFHWYQDASHVLTVNSAHHALIKDVNQFLLENEGR